MSTKSQIEQFLAADQIAMAGVSRNKNKFGYTAFKELREKGLSLIPVNPHAEEIIGVKAYKSVSELPDGIQSILIMTPKAETASVVKQAKEKGIGNIWIQQMSDTPEALALLSGTGINLITGQCIMMYHNPTGIHKFHRAVKKFFGRLPV
ncbi:MAG: CoA-binding protein [Bacteroidales bacterium]|nr:CoA-binding protein [Bacteroidales bacterium]